MSVLKQRPLLSVQEYIADELASSEKHEYLGGFLYAMAGARNQHHRIATSIVSHLYYRLRHQPCQPFNSDTKIRIRLPNQTRFYYPDAMVSCLPNAPEDFFQDAPVMIAEVISESTRRVDEGEKRDAYMTVGSLAVYLLVEQSMPLIIAHRRTENGFIREVYEGLDAVVPLAEIGTVLPLSEIYAGIEFVPEVESP